MRQHNACSLVAALVTLEPDIEVRPLFHKLSSSDGSREVHLQDDGIWSFIANGEYVLAGVNAAGNLQYILGFLKGEDY